MKETGEDNQKKQGSQAGRSFPLRLPRNGQRKPVLWSVAGFDPSGGAGITADLMTFAARGFLGCSAITALTIQSTLGVFGWQPVAPELLGDTLQRLAEDLPAEGIKVGMIGTPAIADVLGSFLEGHRTRKAAPFVVYDPVLRSSSGRELFPPDDLGVLHSKLLPQVDWVTPNWPELALLAESSVSDLLGAEAAARKLIARHPGLIVVATGGDQQRPTDLLVSRGAGAVAIEGQFVQTSSTHGTGCAFSSALVASLVEDFDPVEAVRRAKRFVEGALRHAPGVGGGRGPMGLLWPLDNEPETVGTLEK